MKFSIYDEEAEQNNGPGGERESHSFTRLVRKDSALEITISNTGT